MKESGGGVPTLRKEDFEAAFTPRKPVVFVFHGYPSVVSQLLFGRSHRSRFTVVRRPPSAVSSWKFPRIRRRWRRADRVCVGARLGDGGGGSSGTSKRAPPPLPSRCSPSIRFARTLPSSMCRRGRPRDRAFGE